jgi:hypothetical protein
MYIYTYIHGQNGLCVPKLPNKSSKEYKNSGNPSRDQII